MVVGARQSFQFFRQTTQFLRKIELCLNLAIGFCVLNQCYQIIKKSVRKSQIYVDHANHLNLLKSLLKTKMFAEVYNENLLHTTFLKAVFSLSEEFQFNLSVETYHEYSWQPYQLLDKKFGGGIPQLQILILQEILLPHNDSKRFFFWVVWGRRILVFVLMLHLFQKTYGNLISLSILVMLKNILLQFTEPQKITCVFIVQQKITCLYASKLNLPAVIQKRN